MGKRMLGIAGLLLLALFLTACGESGSSGTQERSTASADASKEACDPVAGEDLVVLEDDQQLQTVDNIIPAVNAEASSDALLEALNTVSAALDTDKLVALNQQTDLERKTSPNAAKEFVAAEGLAEGVSGGSGKVVVGAFNFSESATLANIYAQVLERGRLRRERQDRRQP